MINLPNGTGETLGDTLATCSPIQVSGNVWYVNSVGGVNGASPAGKDKQKPLATLAQAQTNAADGDIVYLLSGHTETLVAALSISKKLTIVGTGSASGKPTVKLYNNSAAAGLLSIASANVELRNIWFPENVQSNTATAKVAVTNVNGFRCVGCYFEAGAFDQNDQLGIAGTSSTLRIVNTTFISTATVVATRPAAALDFSGTCSDADLSGCVFSDGTVGFSSSSLLISGTVTRLKGEALSFLLGADADFSAGTVTGWVNAQTHTGGGSVRW
jgi:hypothetical protein